MRNTKAKYEVNHIRKVLFIVSLLIFIGIFAAPVRANAATADSQAGIVATSGGRLNIRSGASTGAGIVGSLNKGSYVTLISKSGNWWYVEYGKGQYGYCHSDFITVQSGAAATISTQSGNLNVRSSPSTSGTILRSLPKGETVIVLSTSNGWSRILYHGTKTGYVSAQYLSTSYSAVTLNVPSFKQTDTRWANVKIGSSGKTMAQIGCATTAVAMMESFRTGKTIYPDAMAKQLSYDASGSLYWPSHYTVETDSGNYLARIYNLLKQGKPVLFGARNASGKQHWVVITGFTGGTSLSTSAFTVNDPGSNSRTTLQKFLDVYPTFYKYFHY